QVLRLVKPALALLELEMRRGQSGNAERAKGARGGQQPGVRTGHLVQGPSVDFKRRLLLRWDASGHRHNIYIISITCQEKNALPMRFFRPFTKLRADQGGTQQGKLPVNRAAL